jgi:hypothetical protein
LSFSNLIFRHFFLEFFFNFTAFYTCLLRLPFAVDQGNYFYRNRLNSSILMSHESSADSVLDSAVQVLASGNVLSASDACNIVEKLSLADLVAVRFLLNFLFAT